MDLTIDEARKMVANADLWPQVRDYLVRGGEFELFPAGVKSRLKLVDSETLLKIDMWVEALKNAQDWKGIVEGDKVRELKSRYPGVYPEVFRYSAYFSKFKTEKKRIGMFINRLTNTFFTTSFFCIYCTKRVVAFVRFRLLPFA